MSPNIKAISEAFYARKKDSESLVCEMENHFSR
jgi:hypothetical protein